MWLDAMGTALSAWGELQAQRRDFFLYTLGLQPACLLPWQLLETHSLWQPKNVRVNTHKCCYCICWTCKSVCVFCKLAEFAPSFPSCSVLLLWTFKVCWLLMWITLLSSMSLLSQVTEGGLGTGATFHLPGSSVVFIPHWNATSQELSLQDGNCQENLRIL